MIPIDGKRSGCSVAVIVALSIATVPAVLGACRKDAAPGDPTRDWFLAHRRELDAVREMLVADGGLVTSVRLGPLGGLHGAGGSKGHCGSPLRGATFPWKCTGDVVAKNLDDVEAFLAVPKGRLRAYERALPSRGRARLAVRGRVRGARAAIARCMPPRSR